MHQRYNIGGWYYRFARTMLETKHDLRKSEGESGMIIDHEPDNEGLSDCNHLPDQLIELPLGKLRLKVKKSKAFVYYETFIVGEYNKVHLKSRDIVIGTDANVGDYTVRAANKVKNGTVIAIEPNAENVKILMENLALNELQNVIVVEQALSDKVGYASMNGDSTGASITEEGQGSFQVRTTTIEDILQRKTS